MFAEIEYPTVGNLMPPRTVVQNLIHELTEAAAVFFVDVRRYGFLDKPVPPFKAGGAEIFVSPVSLGMDEADVGNRDFALNCLPCRQREADGAEDTMRARVAAQPLRPREPQLGLFNAQVMTAPRGVEWSAAQVRSVPARLENGRPA